MRSLFRSKTVIILSVFSFGFGSANILAATKLPVVRISGGENHTLILGENSQAFSCGLNGVEGGYFGALGTGDGAPYQELTLVRVHGPNNVGFLDGVADIDAGWMHSAVVDVNGSVWTFGDGTFGELGNGLTYGVPDPEGWETIWDGETTPVRVVAGQQDPCDPNSPLRYIIAISAGRSGTHNLVIDANHVCLAWGWNNLGQLGNGQHGTVEMEKRPVYVQAGQMNTTSGLLEHIVEVSAGEDNSMARDSNHFVWTFGDNMYGKLGDGTIYDRYTPVKVRGVNGVNHLENIVAISAGWDHCMALEAYFDPCDPNICGRVFCWGNNAGTGYGGGVGGRLGNGQTSGYKTTPVIIKAGQQDPNAPYLKNIVAISAGESHSMALDYSGRVYTWGDNDYGQLGTGDFNDSPTPVKVLAPDGNGYLGDDIPIAKISAGYWHCLAIDIQGNLYTWGLGEYGRLGLDDLNNRNLPVLVPLYYPPVKNLTKQTVYYKIQDAIDDADANDIIEAEELTYEENINFADKTLTLQSTDPYDRSTVAATVILGTEESSAVQFSGNIGSRLTGFTITADGSFYQYGVYCLNSQVTIEHCIIENHLSYGIECEHSSPTVTNSIIRNNNERGILMWVPLSSVQPLIVNNLIYGNSGLGIELSNMGLAVVIRNNTIVKNSEYGVSSYASQEPQVSNCIVWGNGSDAEDNFYGIDSVNYCCFEEGAWVTGPGNITSNPLFIDVDANNLHLAPGSPCIDRGDPNFADANETDIDGEPRIVDGNDDGVARVDIGADEFYWSKSDFDDSNYVNFIDYAMFATAWATESGDPNYNDLYDLEDDGVIDYKDLSLFCDDWLWQAAWAGSQMMMMAMGGGLESATVAAVKLEVPQPVLLSCQPVTVSQVMVEELLDWVDRLWESGDLADIMTYEQYIEFRQSIELTAE